MKNIINWLNEPNYRTPPLTRWQSYKYFTLWVTLGFILGVTACESMRVTAEVNEARKKVETWYTNN